VAGKKMKDNSWFVGFAPMDAPEIVVVALFEGGTWGALAAPIVRDVIKLISTKSATRAAAPADGRHSTSAFPASCGRTGNCGSIV